jgi:ABC-type spermidine/putrescine transport system permease subunit I
MSTTKRAFPLPVWLAALLMLLAAYLAGLWLLAKEAVPSVSLTDFTVLFRAGSYNGLLPELITALRATLFCLALGYPAGCILALWHHRAAFVSCLIPVLFLAGIALLYGGRLIPLMPQGFAAAFLAGLSGYAAPGEAIAVLLLPLMMLCTCSFAKALDPALASAARCLGASRLRAFLTLTFPRTLKGVPAGFVTVFLPALGLALLFDQVPGTAHEFAVPFAYALLLLTAAAVTICLLILKKARSVSPCC